MLANEAPIMTYLRLVSSLGALQSYSAQGGPGMGEVRGALPHPSTAEASLQQSDVLQTGAMCEGLSALTVSIIDRACSKPFIKPNRCEQF